MGFNNIQFWLFKALHDAYFDAKMGTWTECEKKAIRKTQELIDEIYPFNLPKNDYEKQREGDRITPLK